MDQLIIFPIFPIIETMTYDTHAITIALRRGSKRFFSSDENHGIFILDRVILASAFVDQ